MLAYYFYQANVKNLLWTVILSIILTDDRFLSLVSTVSVQHTKEKQMSSMFVYHFSFSLWGFLKRDILLIEEGNLRECIYCIYLRRRAQGTDENEYFKLVSGLLVYIICLSSLDLV